MAEDRQPPARYGQSVAEERQTPAHYGQSVAEDRQIPAHYGQSSLPVTKALISFVGFVPRDKRKEHSGHTLRQTDRGEVTLKPRPQHDMELPRYLACCHWLR